MYVPYGRYGDELGKHGITEGEYERLAPIADAIIDEWTLSRVGNAVADGVELPEIIQTLYCTITIELPDAMAYEGSGGRLSSFSNGIDSYTFDTTETLSKRMRDRCGWLIDYLPFEWSNVIASEYGRYPR